MILVLWNDAVQFGDGHFVAEAQRAVEDAADGQASEVIAVIQIRDQQLQDRVGIAGAAAGVFARMVSKSGRRLVLSSSGS